MNNESPSKEINDNQNIINDKRKNIDFILNKAINNISNDELINDIKKNKLNPRNFSRPVTALNYKNNNNLFEQTSFKQNNNDIITNNEFINNRGNRLLSYKENKKIGNQGPKTVSVNVYNATMNSLGQFIQASKYNTNYKKKSNSSNQKNNIYYLKQNNANPNIRASGGMKKEETRKIENIFN